MLNALRNLTAALNAHSEALNKHTDALFAIDHRLDVSVGDLGITGIDLNVPQEVLDALTK